MLYFICMNPLKPRNIIDFVGVTYLMNMYKGRCRYGRGHWSSVPPTIFVINIDIVSLSFIDKRSIPTRIMFIETDYYELANNYP